MMGSLRTLHRQRALEGCNHSIVTLVKDCGKDFGYCLQDVWWGVYPRTRLVSYQIVMNRGDYLCQVEIHTEDKSYLLQNLKRKTGFAHSYTKTCDCRGHWKNHEELYQKIYLGFCDAEIY